MRIEEKEGTLVKSHESFGMNVTAIYNKQTDFILHCQEKRDTFSKIK